MTNPADAETEYASIKAHLHPEDSRDKVFSAVLRALLEMGNRPSSPRQLASYILKHGLTQLGGQTPYATVSSRISQHYKRAAAQRRQPVLGKIQDEQRGKKYIYFIASKAASQTQEPDTLHETAPVAQKSTQKWPTSKKSKISERVNTSASAYGEEDGDTDDTHAVASRKRPATPPPSPPSNKRRTRMYSDKVQREQEERERGILRRDISFPYTSEDDHEKEASDSDDEETSRLPQHPFKKSASQSLLQQSATDSSSPSSSVSSASQHVTHQRPKIPSSSPPPAASLDDRTSGDTDMQDSDYYEEMMQGNLGYDDDFLPYQPTTTTATATATITSTSTAIQENSAGAAAENEQRPCSSSITTANALPDPLSRQPSLLAADKTLPPLHRASVSFTSHDHMSSWVPDADSIVHDRPGYLLDFGTDELPDWGDLNDPEKISAADLDQYDQYFSEVTNSEQ
ncbi:uncharacterized protein VTP21DRAFT_9205 [Calcarisporiella thermophila]|uniref:uncharacterized protein n=1 Tax=Calcarisporiella thermophila TaxID=911321 RepID=UPI00374296EE